MTRIEGPPAVWVERDPLWFAKCQLGLRKRADMTPEDQDKLDQLALRYRRDKNFAKKVKHCFIAEKNKLINHPPGGKKESKPKKTRQKSFLPREPKPKKPEREKRISHSNGDGRGSIEDFNSFYGLLSNNVILKGELINKRWDLRELIGFPEGKRGDKVFKTLRKNVVPPYDIFGIFLDYSRVIGKPDEQLAQRIWEVKEKLNEVLNGDLGEREKYRIFGDFVKEYNGRWKKREEARKS